MVSTPLWASLPESETGTTFDKEQFVYDEWFLPSCNDNVLAFNLKESEYFEKGWTLSEIRTFSGVLQ